jgi:cellulose synthase/poly-beta-1,6-N-acetylglucosamine synthase-like glycosyltransferase
VTPVESNAVFIAALSCAVWLYLLVARGSFWRAAQRDDGPAPALPPDVAWPSVAAVVPARDEAAVIGESLATLLRHNYPGRFMVTVVDDHSSDDTEAVTRRSAATAGAPERVTVLAAPSLPGGWTGKLWAGHQPMQRIDNLPEPPEYLLLADADIHLADDTLTALVRRAIRGRLVASLTAKLRCVSLAEHALVPAFVLFFQMLCPFAWVNCLDWATAAWLQVTLAFQPTLRFYGVSPWSGLALPAIAGVYAVFALDSAWQHRRGKGGEWKGRVHRGPLDA